MLLVLISVFVFCRQVCNRGLTRQPLKRKGIDVKSTVGGARTGCRMSVRLFPVSKQAPPRDLPRFQQCLRQRRVRSRACKEADGLPANVAVPQTQCSGLTRCTAFDTLPFGHRQRQQSSSTCALSQRRRSCRVQLDVQITSHRNCHRVASSQMQHVCSAASVGAGVCTKAIRRVILVVDTV